MMEEKISLMPTIAIHTASPFKDLFPIKESVLNEIAEDIVLNEIAEDMKQNGFDFAHPIIIWAGHKVTVVDGHTRLAAAQKIHLNKVPITLKEFASEEEALQYAIKAQSHRRNLTDGELLNCIKELDKRKNSGRPGKSASSEANSKGKSAEQTADLLGISRAKVERIRTVNDHASDTTKAAVLAGKMSINKAYNSTMKKKQQEKMGKDPSLAGATLQDVKESRLEALRVSITKIMKIRLEREVQEYPEIGYSLQERNTLSEELSTEIGKLITEILPGEHDNE